MKVEKKEGLWLFVTGLVALLSRCVFTRQFSPFARKSGYGDSPPRLVRRVSSHSTDSTGALKSTLRLLKEFLL